LIGFGGADPFEPVARDSVASASKGMTAKAAAADDRLGGAAASGPVTPPRRAVNA